MLSTNFVENHFNFLEKAEFLWNVVRVGCLDVDDYMANISNQFFLV
jgi:hypothetical protein